MPPPLVRSIRDIIFWQYAKVLSGVSGAGKSNLKVVLENFNLLKQGRPGFLSSAPRVANSQEDNCCAYCGKPSILKKSLLLPEDRGGPRINENTVLACAQCIGSKGSLRLYEWYGIDSRDILPDAAEAKYLLLLYRLHDARKTLDESFVPNLCARCDMGDLCPEKQVLSVYCLEGCFKKV